jgi:hypothetical protein
MLLKSINNCLNTNIYAYLETSGGQSSNLYLNVVHFLAPGLIRHLWQLKTVFFLYWGLICAVLFGPALLTNIRLGWQWLAVKNSLSYCRISEKGVATFSITTLSIMTLIIMGLFAMLGINGIQHIAKQQTNIEFYHSEFHYAECRYV